MIKWEYNRLTLAFADKYALMTELSRMGALGWELVAIDGGVAFFKRPASTIRWRK